MAAAPPLLICSLPRMVLSLLPCFIPGPHLSSSSPKSPPTSPLSSFSARNRTERVSTPQRRALLAAAPSSPATPSPAAATIRRASPSRSYWCKESSQEPFNQAHVRQFPIPAAIFRRQILRRPSPSALLVTSCTSLQPADGEAPATSRGRRRLLFVRADKAHPTPPSSHPGTPPVAGAHQALPR
nr:uncharacterized protein LOC127320998 [Lolium perenne]